MNRKQFLSRLGIGAAIAVVAPKVLASQPEAVEPALPVMVDVSQIPDGMTPEEFLKAWKENGVLQLSEPLYSRPFLGPKEILAMRDEMQKTIANMPISQRGSLPPYKTGGIWPFIHKEAKLKSFWRKWSSML